MKKPKVLKTTFSTYEVGKQIGQGGNGFVYKATCENEEFAIKVLDLKEPNSEKRKRFKNELMFCSQERNLNIVRVLDSGLTEDDAPFFVMPLYSGSLRELIGKLNGDQNFAIIKGLLDGVEASHKFEVIHRDLKPENILYTKDDHQIVITDYGIARFTEEELHTAVETKAGSRMANFQYAAPEQKDRLGKITKATDIYSLGLIINELFTGERPDGMGHKLIGDDNPDYGYLDGIVDRMLQKNASNRFQYIEEVKREISLKGQEYLSELKLSQLDKTVIPVGEIDDPIVAEPIKVVGGGWDNGRLTIQLSQKTNQRWVDVFHNMSNITYSMNFHPHHVSFNGNEIRISASDDNDANQKIEFIKQWLENAATEYEGKLRQELHAKENQQKQDLKTRKIEENKKLSINKNLKF